MSGPTGRRALRMTKETFLAVVIAVITALQPQISAAQRTIPHPLPSHPGNIFVAGEEVSVPLSSATNDAWRLIDYEGKSVSEGRSADGKAALGKLPAGYYEIRSGAEGKTARVSLGVLEPLRAPTPMDSPIGMDVAMSWCFPKEQMENVANLCTLAGMNRVRDRLLWEQMEPKRGEFAPPNQYDYALDIQRKVGLQVLQVSHVSAAWANPDVTHFPPDLRDIHDFYRELAARWRGRIEAIEPWNEADLDVFGGHTGSEMASLQKAAYLGLKAGNSNVIACENVFAIRRAATLSDFNNNEAWPYFDTFNLHHYEPLQHYPSLYADFRAVSAGKPLWVSECSVLIHWSGDDKLKELSDDDARLQSDRLTKTYTLGIYQGAVAIFYFMLPHYVEGPKQYGILRPDLTPRPAYVAAAAAGRLLAGARPLGRIEVGKKAGQAYCFSAEPDGKPADVLVIWSKDEQDFELPAEPRACFDHLGRTKSVTGKTIKIGSAPVYAVLEKGTHGPLISPPTAAPLLTGNADPLVLQALLPKAEILLDKSAYRMEGGKKVVPVFLYNFGTEKARGRLNTKVPEGWKAEVQPEAEIGPGERKEIALEVSYTGEKKPAQADIRVRGDFGLNGHPVLAFRMVNQ